MDSLDRLNKVYDLCAPSKPSTPPSLEAIGEWLRQHRDRSSEAVEYAWLDAALENVTEARRKK